MPNVKLLPSELIGKIAAGEVVERPSSVVKELIENSIDAGALEVLIEIKKGGREKIVVVDDGSGMLPEDVRLSIERHATSKISNDSDLEKIVTLGFRGEALPSIAAVSHLTIETKHRSSPSGYKIVVSGGKVVEEGEFGTANGTRIQVSDLFFNTPARKKFLKSDRTEDGHIFDFVSRLALSNPKVRFKLISDGKDLLKCLSVNDPKARLLEVFGNGVAEEAISFKEEGSDICLHGFLGDPLLATKTSKGVYLFVNGRIVKDKLLNHAIINGYRSLIPNDSYPFAVAFLEIDPSKVDVNVHPTKQEVRFENGQAVHSFIVNAIRKQLGERRPGIESNSQEALVWKQETRNPTTYAGNRNYFEKIKSSDLSSDPENIVQLLSPLGFYSSLVPIGQFAGSFIICEDSKENLIAIDQHAAHERIGYEDLKSQVERNKVLQQQMLIPEQIELLPKEAALIAENIDLINGFGIEIEPFGGNSFVVKSVPVLLSGVDIRSLIAKLAFELSEIGSSAAQEEIKEKILKTIACHRQVRANQKLSSQEILALFRDMDRTKNIDRCPHGRPTTVKFARSEIEKWFNRT